MQLICCVKLQQENIVYLYYFLRCCGWFFGFVPHMVINTCFHRPVNSSVCDAWTRNVCQVLWAGLSQRSTGAQTSQRSLPADAHLVSFLKLLKPDFLNIFQTWRLGSDDSITAALLLIWDGLIGLLDQRLTGKSNLRWKNPPDSSSCLKTLWLNDQIQKM